jgi:hypothetical protein
MITPENAPPGAEVVCINDEITNHRFPAAGKALRKGCVYTVEAWVPSLVHNRQGSGVTLHEISLGRHSANYLWCFAAKHFRPLDIGNLDKLLTETKIKERA